MLTMGAKTILQTFFSRFFILALNFGIIIFTTNIWGAEARGFISLIIADLAIIAFFSNIIVGGSVSFFAPKSNINEVVSYAYIWTVICGFLLPLLLSFNNHTKNYLSYLIVLSLMISAFTANLNLFLGQQKMRKFNTFSALQNLSHFIFILILYFIFKLHAVTTYFKALILSYSLLFIVSFLLIRKDITLFNVRLTKITAINLFKYGWKTQLSAFIQFLNYRLSYYFLEILNGISSVGIFSVAVAFSESVLTVSRSLALILYSDVINNSNEFENIVRTKFSMKICFILTFFCLIILISVPSKIYTMIFGIGFHGTKAVIIALAPGILFLSVSDIAGHYFAATNQLRILNIKSIFGLLMTILSSFYMIPRWGLLGAGLATSLSYIISSIIIFWKFYKITPFKFEDFMVTTKEIRTFILKLNEKIIKN